MNRIPESISATYYTAKRPWLWQTVMIGAGLLLMPLLLSMTPDGWQFAVFLACFGLVYTGCSPLFRERPQMQIHYVSSITCCVSAVAWCMAMGCLWAVLASGMAALMAILIRPKSYIFWLELGTIASVAVCIICNIGNLW